MILMGLKEGLESVLYLGMVVSIFWFIFAISGQIWFHSNDSLHFGTFYLAASTISSLHRGRLDRGNVQQCRRVCKLCFTNLCVRPKYTNCAARLDDVNDVTALEELACCCEENLIHSLYRPTLTLGPS